MLPRDIIAVLIIGPTLVQAADPGAQPNPAVYTTTPGFLAAEGNPRLIGYTEVGTGGTCEAYTATSLEIVADPSQFLHSTAHPDLSIRHRMLMVCVVLRPSRPAMSLRRAHLERLCGWAHIPRTGKQFWLVEKMKTRLNTSLVARATSAPSAELEGSMMRWLAQTRPHPSLWSLVDQIPWIGRRGGRLRM